MRLIKVKLLIDYWAGQNLLLVPITVAVMWICNSSGSLIIFFPEHTVCLRSLVKSQLHTYYKKIDKTLWTLCTVLSVTPEIHISTIHIIGM